MTDEQMAHIGVMNSFNLITERVTLDEIINSNVSFFAHSPEDDIDIAFISFLVKYFKAHEMFENCHELMKYRDKYFDEDGNYLKKKAICECELPEVKEYTMNSICFKCNKYIG